MIFDEGRGYRGFEFERIEVGWDPIHSSKAFSALAFQSRKNGKNKFISMKIFSRRQRDLRFLSSFFLASSTQIEKLWQKDDRTGDEWGNRRDRGVFMVIRCQGHDCPVYTTCEYAFPQHRHNYANDSIFAKKFKNFLENPRDEGMIIKESCFRKDSRNTRQSCNSCGIFYRG